MKTKIYSYLFGSVVMLSLTALPVWAQAGGQDGADTSGAGAGASGGTASSSSVTSAGASGGSAGAEGLLGLRPSQTPERISLPEALKRTLSQNYDLRQLDEKIVQQEAQVRKAWSMILPQLSASVGYTFACQVGVTDRNTDEYQFLNCQDQNVAFTSEAQLKQQALLFESLGGVVEQAANFSNDPVQQEQQREQARQLFAAADQLKSTEVKPVTLQAANTVNTSVTLSMPIFSGRAIPLLQNAYSAVDLVNLSKAQAERAMTYAVVRAYYGAVTTQKLATIAEERLNNTRAHYNLVKTRFENKSATILILQKAELDVLKAEQQVQTVQDALSATLAALGSLWGQVDQFTIDPPAIGVLPIQTEEEMTAAATENRLDLKTRKLALQITERNILDAWMQFAPTVSLVGQFRASSNTSGFVSTLGSSSLTIQANIPLYDGGARYANLDDVQSKIREEKLKIAQLEEKIGAQVRGNLRDIAAKERALVLSQKTAALAQTSFTQAQTLYQNGVATSTDVSDANLALYASENDLANAEIALALAKMGLHYVVGAPFYEQQ